MAGVRRAARVAWCLGLAATILVVGFRASAVAAPHACAAGLSSRVVFPVFSGGEGARTVSDVRSQLGGKAWGLDENVTVDLDRANLEPILTVRLPKGSINPKNKTAPLGGMGWRWRPIQADNIERACVRYRVRFAPAFRFGLGGKLPGLFGGNGPAGGKVTDGLHGFSMRLMWRRGGAGEVYAYVPGHPKGRGESIQRGAWHFKPGHWMEVAQEVVLNRPDGADGRIRVWIDGALRLDVSNLVIRRTAKLGLTGVMGDVFFGGKSPKWAAPQDSFIQFSAFELFR